MLSTGVLAVGLLMEGIEHLKWLPKSKLDNDKGIRVFPWKIFHLKERTVVIGWFVVALGVAGEGFFEWRGSQADAYLGRFNEILISDARSRSVEAIGNSADANKDAANARERAGKLEKEGAVFRKQAEDERMARIRLQERVAWRTISPADIAAIGARLRVHRDIRIAIAAPAGNDEGVSFSEDLAAVAIAAQWNFRGITSYGNLGVQRFGVHVSATRDDQNRTAGEDLARELAALGFQPALEISENVFAGGGPGVYVRVELRPRVVPIQNKTP